MIRIQKVMAQSIKVTSSEILFTDKITYEEEKMCCCLQMQDRSLARRPSSGLN